MFSLLLGAALVLGQSEPKAKASLLPPVIAPVASESLPNDDTNTKQNNSNGGDPYRIYERFPRRLWNAYFGPEEESNGEEPKRRGMSAPFESPPFPGTEYLMVRPIGVPHTDVYPLMKAIYDGPHGKAWKDSRIQIYGRVATSF